MASVVEPVMGITIVGVLIGLAVVVGGACSRRAYSARRNRLASRPVLPLDTIAGAAEAEILGLDRHSFEQLMKRLAESIGVPAGVLRLDDRFRVELVMHGWDSEDDMLLTVYEWLKAHPDTRPGQEVITLRDLLERTCRS